MSSRSLSSRPRSSSSPLIVALVVGTLLFAGCAADDRGVSAPSETTPAPTAGTPAEFDADAMWLDGGRAIGIVTWGSSTCVPAAQNVTVGTDGAVAVELGPGSSVAIDSLVIDGEDVAGSVIACTADYAPRVTPVFVPPGADATAGIDLVVTLEGGRDEVDLDPYTGPDVDAQSPSAGWIDDGLFAVLTWGSSSCAPVVESVEKTSATAVSVVFSSNGETACTDDLAARVVLAWVEGVDDDAAVTATLSGREFPTPVTIPIS